MKGLERQAKRTGVQMNQFGGALTGTGKNLRKFAMGGLQQAGYQIGDYAVQVANGTSKMQAFGQQAPQLLQIFGPIGSIAGAAVSVFAAYAVAQEKMGEASKGLTGSLLPLDQALQNIRKSTAETRAEIALLTSGFESAEEASLANAIRLQEAVVAQKKLNFENARGNALVGAENQLNAERGKLTDLEQELENLRSGNKERAHTLDYLNDILGTAEGHRMAEEALNQLYEARLGTIDDTANNYVDILGTAEGLRLQEEALNQLYLQRQTAYDDVLGTTEGLRKQEEALNQIFLSRLGTIDDTFNNYVDILGTEEGLAAATQATNDLYAERLRLKDEEYKKNRDNFMVEASVLVQEQKIAELREAWAKKKAELNKDTVTRAKTFRREITKLTPEVKRARDLADSIGNSFEKSFMSAIDGSMKAKDAFRTMASDIIKELYRVFVVKKITGFISDFVGMAALPAGGSYTGTMGLPRFDGGGYTGNGARSGGMDGKGGFMAMLHPRETVVDHTRGQGGGVTVVQNINVSTGVQQTVRTEIKSLMPQIAESAKAAVADAKRRGGSYGRAFA
jgi:hypothetical protein